MLVLALFLIVILTGLLAGPKALFYLKQYAIARHTVSLSQKLAALELVAAREQLETRLSELSGYVLELADLAPHTTAGAEYSGATAIYNRLRDELPQAQTITHMNRISSDLAGAMRKMQFAHASRYELGSGN